MTALTLGSKLAGRVLPEHPIDSRLWLSGGVDVSKVSGAVDLSEGRCQDVEPCPDSEGANKSTSFWLNVQMGTEAPTKWTRLVLNLEFAPDPFAPSLSDQR